MPTFCRHNRLLQNCTICAREQNFEARPVVSSSAPKIDSGARALFGRAAVARRSRKISGSAPLRRRKRSRRACSSGLARGVEDGFRSPLVPGLKSSEDADRLAEELAFATWRLLLMELVAAGEIVADATPIWLEIAAQVT